MKKYKFDFQECEDELNEILNFNNNFMKKDFFNTILKIKNSKLNIINEHDRNIIYKYYYHYEDFLIILKTIINYIDYID